MKIGTLLNTHNTLSDFDKKLIEDVVIHYGTNQSFTGLSKVLFHIFGENISFTHFIYLGVELGKRTAPKSTATNHNSFLLWQRPN